VIKVKNSSSKNKKYATILIETDGLSSKQLSQIERITKIIGGKKKARSPSMRKKNINYNNNSLLTNSQFTTLNVNPPHMNQFINCEIPQDHTFMHNKTFS
jgi:hypothetical protein